MDGRELIDVARYPIDDPGSQARADLIARCRAALDEEAIATLPGFAPPTVVQEMAREVEALTPRAYHNDNLRTAYGWMYNRDFPSGHARAALHRNVSDVILTHQIPPDSLVARLYRWDALTEFVREALGFETLHRCACPHLSLMCSAMGEGGRFGWHFDTNDGVVSLLLQQADQGGDFECAPYIRDEDDENYDAVERLFSGAEGLARRPAMAPGTFILFKGRRSCHRVTEVGATRAPRLIALFSYDERPGMVFPKATAEDLMNPSGAPFYGRAAP